MINRKRAFQYRDAGILVLRSGIGLIMILHGYPKLFGGPEVWEQAGQFIGMDAMPVFFGFLAGIIELFGGLFLMFGLFYRPALVLLILLMLLKIITGSVQPEVIGSLWHSITLLIVFVSMLFLGSGIYSLDKKLKMRGRRRRY